MDMIIIGVALVILIIALVLFLKRPRSTQELSQLKTEADTLRIDKAKAEERSAGLAFERDKAEKNLQEERLRYEAMLRDVNIELNAERSRLTRAEETFKAQRERLAEQELYMQELQQKFKLEFENVAERLLKEKSREFVDTNKANMDHILNPLKENLKVFEEKVDKVYNMEAAERNTLKGVITQLMELNKQISDEAQNLTKALKGDTKKQGNWGEVVLERVLERSGLVRDREYRVQASLQTVDGTRFQPDVIIDLPDDKHLIIDAKVSLVAYERLVNAETEDERKLYSKAHVESIRSHVLGLSSKNYHDLHQINSPDFVLLFVPIESSFSFAVQLDAELFSDAWDRRVVIVSPSTLLATLRTISSIWKQERQNRNVLEIARLSGEMYDKFVGFVGDMESIGKNIKQSQDAYDKALNKLTDGRGNLTITADKIKKLGAKANKQIDQKYIGEE
ncbi:DNA recombination protein RmuC [Mucilaginibacter myungsuensis]|uniref:DNA recombination protein RmuC n=1 Tax=Mucilaginibacter myungsuensis TaxID=649104 RepID=A0A929PYD2_9SPHI|nr:DNA recombination protein RmuC [Mucilaginibacter myungsuensis]MBE9664054.1 DNA recombination protein RmuC [Mucilaginibacter myungsuensis]MDN3601232.1 DNA recombination protein RmuC [Mucilaginibacter myungsuensis]